MLLRLTRPHWRMFHFEFLHPILAGLLLIGGALMMSSCSKKSTKPEPTAYSVIVVDEGVSRSVYFIDPDSMEVVDSIPRVGLAAEGAVSPDGESLYLYTLYEGGDPAGLYKYDLGSKTQVGFLPLLGGMVLTEGGRKIITAGFDSLYVINTDRFEITETRPAPVLEAYGRLDADIIAGAVHSAPPVASSVLAVYNFVTEASDTIRISDVFRVRQCFIHPDRQRVFVVGFRSGFYRLFVVDLVAKEAREIFELRSFLSRIEFTGTGDKAYLITSEDLDNPDLIGCGMGEIVCLNTAGDDYAVLERVETDAPLLSVALSPSGDRLYVGQTLNFCGDGGDILVYDTGDLTSPPDTIALPRKQSGPIEILPVP